MSSPEELFPRTPCQILSISAAERTQVLQALDRVVWALVEAGEAELAEGRKHSDAEGCCGRDAGEFIFRAVLPDRATGKIIGPRGTYIQALREETGAKVFVENERHHGHQ